MEISDISSSRGVSTHASVCERVSRGGCRGVVGGVVGVDVRGLVGVDVIVG